MIAAAEPIRKLSREATVTDDIDFTQTLTLFKKTESRKEDNPMSKYQEKETYSPVSEYLREGITNIDAIFGDGYARAHPELLAAFIQTAALDFGVFTIVEAIEKLIGGTHWETSEDEIVKGAPKYDKK
jgi:hypothetical protein